MNDRNTPIALIFIGLLIGLVVALLPFPAMVAHIATIIAVVFLIAGLALLVWRLVGKGA